MNDIEKLRIITQKMIEYADKNQLPSGEEIIAYLLALKDIQEEKNVKPNTILNQR